MPEFSYAKDIAPYASKFFREAETNQFLSAAQRADVSGGMLDAMERGKERKDKEEARSLEMELGRSRLDSQRIALEDARLDHQLKRDAIASAPDVDAELAAILDDPDTPQKVKMADINRLAMKHATTIAYSPSLSHKFQFAARAAEPTYELTPKDRIALGRWQESRQDRLTKQITDREDKKERLEAARQNRILEGFEKDLERLVTEDPKDFIPTKENPVPKPVFKYPSYRAEALSLLKEHSPETYDQFKDADPDAILSELHRVKRALRATVSPVPEKKDSDAAKASSLFDYEDE